MFTKSIENIVIITLYTFRSTFWLEVEIKKQGENRMWGTFSVYFL